MLVQPDLLSVGAGGCSNVDGDVVQQSAPPSRAATSIRPIPCGGGGPSEMSRTCR